MKNPPASGIAHDAASCAILAADRRCALSRYTTGEIAKLCGVTVRTIQYYDTRGILTPSDLTEGGRRLYGEDDVRRCRIICFLREMDLSIDAISRMLKEEHP